MSARAQLLQTAVEAAQEVHSGRGGLYYRGRGGRIAWGAFILAALFGLVYAWLR
jgi:hypothetical protein